MFFHSYILIFINYVNFKIIEKFLSLLQWGKIVSSNFANYVNKGEWCWALCDDNKSIFYILF